MDSTQSCAGRFREARRYRLTAGEGRGRPACCAKRPMSLLTECGERREYPASVGTSLWFRVRAVNGLQTHVPNQRIRLLRHQGGLVVVKSLRVENFRSVRDATLTCDSLTALVGANGSGKSSFLTALDFFYQPAAEYSAEDFHAGNSADPIRVTVTFTGLTPEESELFGKYVENGELTVEKEMAHPRTRGSQRYYGTSLANPDFQPVRDAAGNQKRGIYNELKQRDAYRDLPTYRNMEQAESELAAWETAHLGACVRSRDGGQFFGFREVGEAHLEGYTSFVLVPAVRDAAADAGAARDAALSQLMNLVVMARLSQREDITAFRQATQEQYSQITNPDNLPELAQLAGELTDTLSMFAPDTSVHLDWEPQTIEIPMPRANARLQEDDYLAPVSRTGHGLQRAFILTLLQHLAAAQSAPAQPEGGHAATNARPRAARLPGLILAIEEPELYQHPSRQRAMAEVLLRLSQGQIPGVAGRTQIVYATHSPLFLGLDRFDQVRILRKGDVQPGAPKQTIVYSQMLEELADRLSSGRTRALQGEQLRSSLRSLMTPLANEAFFAKTVCLVEGSDDHSLLTGYARARGISFDLAGVCIVGCSGKEELKKALVLFRGFGIPTYPVFDGDRGNPSMKRLNRDLLRLLGEPEVDYPSGIFPHYAAFETDMRQCISHETGGALEEHARAWCDENSVPASEVWRHVACLTTGFERCLANAGDCASLSAICSHVLSLSAGG